MSDSGALRILENRFWKKFLRFSSVRSSYWLATMDEEWIILFVTFCYNCVTNIPVAWYLSTELTFPLLFSLQTSMIDSEAKSAKISLSCIQRFGRIQSKVHVIGNSLQPRGRDDLFLVNQKRIRSRRLINYLRLRPLSYWIWLEVESFPVLSWKVFTSVASARFVLSQENWLSPTFNGEWINRVLLVCHINSSSLGYVVNSLPAFIILNQKNSVLLFF